MKTLRPHKLAAVSLAEVSVALTIGIAVLAMALSFMRSSAILFAKTSGLNQSHQSARASFERLSDLLQRANNVPTPVDTAGNTTTAPAAGVIFDNFIGTPYIVTHPGGAGLAASATSLTVTRSTAPRSAPPLPRVGDALLIDFANAPVRALISAVTPGTLDTVNQRQPVTVTLAAPLGTAISWNAADAKTADLVRREAFIVMPAGTRNELRHYPRFEPVPALDSTANYAVVTDQIGNSGNEGRPFTVATVAGDTSVTGSITAKAVNHAAHLANKQAAGFNTVVKMNTVLTSRIRPKH